MRKLLHAVLIVLSISTSTMALASPVPEYEMKSTYLYYFAVYAIWADAVKSNLNICIVGKNLIGASLSSLENTEINGKRVAIKHLKNLENMSTCQMLYFSESDIYSPKQILSAVGDSPILTITDAPISNGFMIHLKLEKNRLIFDINYEAIKKNHLTISSKVLNLAHHVY